MNKDQYRSYKNHWITSDLHFNHENIIQYQPNTRGQFANVDVMNDTIIERFNSDVGPDDHTFIIGDIGMGDTSKVPALLKRMNGKKTIIKGNHDRSTMKLPEFQTIETRHEMGVVGVFDYYVISPSKGSAVVMMHFPIASWDGLSRGSIMMHGHLHSDPDKRHIGEGRIVDVGADGNNLHPYHFEDLVAEMKKRPIVPMIKGDYH